MSWEIGFVLGLLALALVSFALEKLPTDLVAILVFAVLLGAGSLPFAERLPNVEQLLGVFANPAPMTVAAMFILSGALESCGAIRDMARMLDRLTRLGYRVFLAVLVLAVAFTSAFVNNTPVVMVFLPVVLSLSRSVGVPASKLLIPLSYASIFGGTCTLVGTSTNILASGLLHKAGYPPLGMFELTAVGVPLLIAGTLYLALFGHRLLPDRETLTSLLTEEERKEFITEAFVQPGSALSGRTLAESKLLGVPGVRVLELIRDEVALGFDPKTTQLQESDRLVLACRPAGVAHAHSIDGIALQDIKGVGFETVSAREGAIVEGILGPRSTIVGRALSDINFRQRFRVVLLAIHRRGVNLRRQIGQVTLESGDLLLMMGTSSAIENLRRSDDILLLDKPHTPPVSMRRKTPWVLATIAGVVAVAAFELMPIAAAALIGVAVIFASGSLTPKEGYASIEWSILVLIYSMLGLGLAIESTGAADLLARGLSSVAAIGWIPDPARPYVALALLYLGTMVLTETLSNNATVVLMTPIALSLAAALQVDVRPFAIAVCIASSASFSTPIGYQTNTYVYGVGGYRFTDFLRIGLPLNLLYFVLSVLLIPRLWSF